MSTSQRIAGTDWLMLMALSLVWGGSFLFYRVLAFQLPPLSTVIGRTAIGAAGLLLVSAVAGGNPVPPRRTWGRFALLGLINGALPFTAFAWAEHRVGGGTASILNAMTPIFTVMVTGLLLRTEPVTPSRVGGIACGFLGVGVLVGPSALLGQDVFGQFACLGAALCYAFGVPFARTITGAAPLQMAVGQLVAASVLLLPVWLWFDRPWSLPAPSAAGWASLLGIGLLSTSIAYIMFFRLLGRIGATNLVLVTFMIPVSALALGALLSGEQLTTAALVGMAVITAGLACIDGRVWRLRETLSRQTGLS